MGGIVEQKVLTADTSAHKLYGTLPWKDLVMPVAELARQYQVSRELARRLRIFGYASPLTPTSTSITLHPPPWFIRFMSRISRRR